MNKDIKTFGSQAGSELIKAFKGIRLQESLGNSVTSVQLTEDELQKRLKIWEASPHGPSKKLGKQLSEALHSIVQGNSELDEGVLLQKMEFEKDIDSGFGYEECLGRSATVQLLIQSSVYAYKCKSLQELATADYVLKLKVSAVIEEINTKHRFNVDEDELLPWAAQLTDNEGGLQVLHPVPFLAALLNQGESLTQDEAQALYEVFCGFRLSPSLVNRKESLCEVLSIKGKRIMLVGDETLSLKVYPKDPSNLRVDRLEQHEVSDFFFRLNEWQLRYVGKADYIDFTELHERSTGYADLEGSKVSETIFNFNNSVALLSSALSSTPLKKWLSSVSAD